MEQLWEIFSHSWWFYAQTLFTIAMVIHVYRVGAEPFWYFVILFLQPFGAWVYFIVFIVRHARLGSGGAISTGALWQRKLSLDELRYHAERMPTVNNRIAFAQGLMAKGRHAEAIPILEGVLAADQIHCQAMHDLAICHLACGDAEQSVAMLRKLLDRDYRWGYYRAWRTLIDAQTACQKPNEALKACRELAKMLPTLENKCLLAEHLMDNNLKPEAIEVLDQALEDNDYLPWNKRLKNWGWARHARRLLQEAETK
jgi:hypothetical protein